MNPIGHRVHVASIDLDRMKLCSFLSQVTEGLSSICSVVALSQNELLLFGNSFGFSGSTSGFSFG